MRAPPDGYVLLPDETRIRAEDKVWSPFSTAWRRPHDHEVNQVARNFYAVARLTNPVLSATVGT